LHFPEKISNFSAVYRRKAVEISDVCSHYCSRGDGLKLALSEVEGNPPTPTKLG
jgi:hypothetical protein